MPYTSEAQRGYMHAKHPQIAARWDREYDAPKQLPGHARQAAYDRAAKRIKGAP